MPRLRASAPASHAFTLVEMLIVIGILMLLLGLTAGSVLRTPKVDAVAGTEQLLTDMIRQARHTARSSGSPVLLKISAANGTVMGVSQVPIWSETFEESPTVTPWQTPFGQTGFGLTSPGGNPPPLPPSFSVPHNLALTRNAATTSGFYLTCAVNLPDVSVLNATSPVDKLVIPLVLVGNQTDGNATCGLALKWEQIEIQEVTDTSGNVDQKWYQVWDVIGWVNDATNGVVQVKSVENTVYTPGMQLQSTAQDVASPIVGGRWEDLGLLYDGSNLELMRNGIEIASLAQNSPSPSAPQPPTNLSGTLIDTTGGNGPQSVFVAAAYMPILTQEPNPPMSFLQGTMDNCRLFRLGTDLPTALPSGSVPASDYTLRVRPDGIVEFMAGGSAPTLGGTMSFAMAHSAASPGQADAVQITVNPDGSLASMMSIGATSTSASTVQ